MGEQIVWLSTAQVAKRLGCSSSNVWKLINRGTLPAVRDGSRYRVREDVLAAFKAERGTIRSNARRASGARGNHNRWHAARGGIDPECELCR